MPTYDQTMRALYGAEEKWERVRAGRAMDYGGDDCPLCALYDDCSHVDGDMCPIAEDTGFRFCHKTPHYAWCEYCLTAHDGFFKVFDEKSFDLADDMLQYIRKVIKKWEGKRG